METRIDIPTLNEPGSQELEYQHVPLEDSERQFRLLEFLPPTASNEHDDIRCVLRMWDRDAAPEYSAISYTWGSARNPETILVDEQPFSVRSSCRYALWQARLHGYQRVWIDSVCINQNDNKEKGHQVRSMMQIYERAASVLACTGPHKDRSRLIFDSIIPELQAKFHDQGEDYYSTTPASLDVMLYKLTKSSVDFALDDCVQAFCRFANRSYFQRLWVLQEVFAGAFVRVRVLCGDSATSLRWIRDVTDIFRSGDFTDQDDRFRSAYRIKSVWRRQVRNSILVKFFGILAQLPVRIDSLSNVKLGTLRCSDKRDMLYGILGLVKWPPDIPEISPDYTKTAYEVLGSFLPFSFDFESIYIIAQLFGRSLLNDSRGIGLEDPDLRRGWLSTRTWSFRCSEHSLRIQRINPYPDWTLLDVQVPAHVSPRKQHLGGLISVPTYTPLQVDDLIVEWSSGPAFKLALRKQQHDNRYRVVAFVPEFGSHLFADNDLDLCLGSATRMEIQLTDDEVLLMACILVNHIDIGSRAENHEILLKRYIHLEGRMVKYVAN